MLWNLDNPPAVGEPASGEVEPDFLSVEYKHTSVQLQSAKHFKNPTVIIGFLILLYYSCLHFFPYFCNVLFTCLSQTALVRLQLVQMQQLLSRTVSRAHITPILTSMYRLPEWIHLKIILTTFEAIHGLAPHTTRRPLRSSSQNLLEIQCARLKTKGDAHLHLAPGPWNSQCLFITVSFFLRCTLHLKSVFSVLYVTAKHRVFCIINVVI